MSILQTTDCVSQEEGVVFDIKRFSIQDGPGIRTTVFFKGCPLRCSWCHNPESYRGEPEVVFYSDRCISGSHSCLVKCPKGAFQIGKGEPIDRAKCVGCGDCARSCPAEAIQLIGQRWDVADLLTEIEKDRIFFDASEGGVTFSGGEPLLQDRFLREILHRCRQSRLHTTVDTCGHSPWPILHSLLPDVDLFLFDLKLIDPHLHRLHTGVTNQLILENLKLLGQLQAPVLIRLPLIPGITATEENTRAIIRFLDPFPSLRRISLLNYHRGGIQKMNRLAIPDSIPGLQPLPAERMQWIRGQFVDEGFEVSIGE